MILTDTYYAWNYIGIIASSLVVMLFVPLIINIYSLLYKFVSDS